MATSTDIVIVGGGIIGLTAAYLLAKEGQHVTVLDQGDFGQEASWAGAGIIPPGNPSQAVSPFDRLRSISAAGFPDLAAELREVTGIDNGYVRCGGLEFADGEEATCPEEWRGAGIQVEHLTTTQTHACEPALAQDLGAAYRLPALAQVRNPRHVKALVAANARAKVRLLPGHGACELVLDGQRIQGVRTPTDTIRAGIYLIAAGAWTDSLLSGLGCRLDIQPVRGQIALLRSTSSLFRHVLLWGNRYIVPRQDGRVLVGSTEEHVGFDKRATAAAQQELLSLACRLVPNLAGAALERSWAGLRPGSPDGLPFIGPVPGYPNVFVAAGHYRAGIQLSLGTALLLKELILRQALTIAAEPFRLDRAGRAG